MVSLDEVAGFVAQPSGEGRYPAVIMIHEWWGLNDQIKSMAHILAGEGYVVFAVDLFEGRVAATAEEARENIARNPNDRTLPRMQAGLRYLKTLPNVDSSRIAGLGWYYGGGQSFLLGVNEGLQAVVIFYGQVSAELAVLRALNEPVLGVFGADDQSIPASTVRAFESALKGLGTQVEIHIYEGAGHAFANPTNSQAFRKEQAVDAWAKTLDSLKRTLQES